MDPDSLLQSMDPDRRQAAVGDCGRMFCLFFIFGEFLVSPIFNQRLDSNLFFSLFVNDTEY